MDSSGRIEPIDTDAVLWSASEHDRADRPLLVILHGFGSHEGDLFALTPHLPLRPVMASLRAPLSAGSGGWAWFPLDREEGSEAVDAATLGVLQWLDALATPPTSVGLLGFSQGGVMALQLMRHAPDRFDFVVQLSGFVAPGPRPGDERLAARRPPVFWGRGTADEVIPADAVDWTQDWLPEHSTLTQRIYERMPHTVSDAELRDVVSFLRDQYRA
jgi:phospholipase/carboxylesterase